MGGFVDRIYVGPDQILRPLYDVRYCLLKTLPRLAVAWQAALALCLLIVWLGRRNKRMFLTLCIILILGVLNGVSLFMSERDGWGMLLCVANLTNLWSGSLLPGLLAELVGRPVPMRSRWALGIPAAISILFVAGLALPGLPQAWFEWLRVTAMLPWMIAMMGLSIWIVVEAAFRRDDAAAQLLLGGLAVVAMLIVHDLLLYFGVVAGQGVLLTRFAGPLMMTLISALLMWRFAMALNEVSRFNYVLRLEVSAAEETLRASFAREQVQVRAAALEAERLRLTRDLHDGLAGQLVSIAAQCELSGPSFRSISLAARRAVDDLRLVVASLDDVGNDLAVMMAQFRERTEPQLKAQGIDLDWQTAELPEIEGLRSEHVLALFRILQEAVGNAARHSGCRMVTVTMTADDTGNAVEIVVADRGRGGAAPRSGGNGLLNMRRRAESLGAGFAVESGVDGTRVVIRLPRILPGLVIVPRQPFRT
jgi:signal transduction histidine kinase